MWQRRHSERGFTVIELLVVFTIIVLLSGVIIINWNSQTPRRTLGIAQNELVTNIRKTQSYAVNSRNINGTMAAKFYFIKFQKDQNGYSISASDGASTPVFYPDLETFKLGTGLTISNITLTSTTGGSNITPNCVMLAVSAIYGKNYFLADTCDSSALTIVNNPATLAPKANYNMTLTIFHAQKNISKTVSVYGLTGKVDAN